jgi:hypothetical protein
VAAPRKPFCALHGGEAVSGGEGVVEDGVDAAGGEGEAGAGDDLDGEERPVVAGEEKGELAGGEHDKGDAVAPDMPEAVGNDPSGNFHDEHRQHKGSLETGDFGDGEVPLEQVGGHERHEEVELAEEGDQPEQADGVERADGAE